MNRRNRRAFTMIELLFASIIVALFMILVYSFFISGQRTITSTSRKVDAIGQTHLRFEEVRHDLETAAWAWAPSEPASLEEMKLGGGPILYVDGREYAFDG